jgi:hypothetical protein
MAENLIAAWDRITPDVIESAWAIYQGDWGVDMPEKPESDPDDGEHRPEVGKRTFRIWHSILDYFSKMIHGSSA